MAKSVLSENVFLSDEWKQLQRKFPLVANIVAEVIASSVDFDQYQDEMKLVRGNLASLEKKLEKIDALLTRYGIAGAVAPS